MTDSLRTSLQKSLGNLYTIERELAGGGMAHVFLAEEVSLQRKVVVKVLSPEQAQDLSAERFQREIRFAASLQQANIVPVLAAGEVHGLPWYAMPFVDGQSLRGRLSRGGTMQFAEVISLLRDVTRALAYAHSRGIVHRDIKPENILLSGGTAVVTDFGIAKAIAAAVNGSRASERGDGTQALTLIGTVVGTPQYMAPEQAAGDTVDHRADIYALGCLAYELLAGAAPFAGRSGIALLSAHLAERPAPLVERRPDVPDWLAALVMRCLEKDPAQRPQAAAEVLSELDVRRESTLPPSTAAPPGDRPSLAVLPFANLSPDPENEFFADGLSEELMADLSAVKGMRVISRTSAMQYKGSGKTLPVVARELGVRYVLEGSVRRAGHALRIAAQLSDATTDAQVWAGKFSGTMDDVFDLQERISREIVAALQVTLDASAGRRLAARPIGNVLAYDCYLKARRELMSFTADGFERAFALLRDALALVGDNALLYAARSYAYTHLVQAGMSPDAANVDRAEADARRALELDPGLAQAHFALGYAAAQRGDLARALRHFGEAEVLDPTSADTLFWHGIFLICAGHITAARERSTQLQAIEPVADFTIMLQLFIETLAGSWDSALAVWDRLLARGGPPDAYSVNAVAVLVLRTPRAADGIAHLALADETLRASGICRTSLFMAFARLGDAASADAVLDDSVLALAQHDGIGAWLVASAYALLGRHDAALEWLETAATLGFVHHRFVGAVDPVFAALRNHPHFTDLLERMRRSVAQAGTPRPLATQYTPR